MLRNLLIRNKKVIVVLVVVALTVPLIAFFSARVVKNNPSDVVIPTKMPFPTFAQERVVDGELTIQYAPGYEFEILEETRQDELISYYESLGAMSHDKLFDPQETVIAKFYILKFSEGINMEEAAKKIYELPEIVGAEPNYEVGIF